MLKWGGKGKDGRVILGFGLEPKNLELLSKGRPILASCKVGAQTFDICIYAGETTDKMLADLRDVVLILLPQTMN